MTDRMIQRGVVLAAMAGVAGGGGAALAQDEGSGQARFSLVTQAAGLSNATFIPNTGYPSENAIQAGGVGVGDFNNDGWVDLFVPSGGTGPDKLYINRGDGTFVDQAAAWGVNKWSRSAGVAVGDFDGDGYLDLYVVSYGDFPFPAAVGRSKLYRNLGPDANGQWRFVDVAQQAGVANVFGVIGGMGAAFGDYDLDGHLDLFVSTWIFFPGGNRLFRNNGDGTFTNVSEILPQEQFPLRGFTPNFADIDDDGWPDLLLTNDFFTSRLYRNSGRRSDGSFAFENITQAAGITEDCNGMGATLADLDGDGRLDWFMTNIYLPKGSPGCANTLYRGLGVVEGVARFEDVGVASGAGDTGWAWGVTAFDVTNDGWTDLAAVGGWPRWPGTPMRLYMNNGNGTFTDRAQSAGVAWTGQGRGLVHFDYNNDGRVDMFAVNNGAVGRLYRNDSTGTGNWLRLDFDTSMHPCAAPRGVGTRVWVTAGDRTWMQLLDSRTTFLSQSEQTLHFGLGTAEAVDSVEIRWADGSGTVLYDVGVNQRLTVQAFHDADIDRNRRLDFFDIAAFLNAYIAGDAAADADRDGVVTPADIGRFVDRFWAGCP